VRRRRAPNERLYTAGRVARSAGEGRARLPRRPRWGGRGARDGGAQRAARAGGKGPRGAPRGTGAGLWARGWRPPARALDGAGRRRGAQRHSSRAPACCAGDRVGWQHTHRTERVPWPQGSSRAWRHPSPGCCVCSCRGLLAAPDAAAPRAQATPHAAALNRAGYTQRVIKSPESSWRWGRAGARARRRARSDWGARRGARRVWGVGCEACTLLLVWGVVCHAACNQHARRTAFPRPRG
jgi:hypothetical protein